MELELDGCFSSVVALGALLELLELDGAALDGVLLEPAPAEPLGTVTEPLKLLLEPEPEGAAPDGALDGAALDEDEVDPLGWSFLLMSIEVDEELELGGVAVVPPADDVDDEVPGALLAPEGAVDLSHAAISDAPSANETATAIVDNLMKPPWLGYKR